MASNDAIAYLDRRMRGLVGVYAGGVTTWTLPYVVAVDGSEGILAVAVESTRGLLVSTRPSETQIAVAGDITGMPVCIGVMYQFTYVPSKVYLRDSRGNVDLTGKITLHHVAAKIAETLSIGSIVSRKGRSTSSQQAKTFARPTQGDFTIPVHGDRDDVQVIIKDNSASACVLTGLTWSGTLRSPTGRKV